MSKDYNFCEYPMRAIDFETKDKAIMAAALAFLKELRDKEGVSMLFTLNSIRRIIVMAPERVVSRFGEELKSCGFWDNVRNVTRRRDKILDALNLFVRDNDGCYVIGEPTQNETFFFVKGKEHYTLAIPYRADGSIDELELEERFKQGMHTRSPLEYDYWWKGLAKDIADVLRPFFADNHQSGWEL